MVSYQIYCLSSHWNQEGVIKIKDFGVCLVQLDSILGNMKLNTDAVLKKIAEASEKYPDVNMVVFPEMVLAGYECGERFNSLAATLSKESDWLRPFCKIALEKSLFIVFGYPELSDQGAIFNSLVVIDTVGNIKGNYRKVHLIPPDKPHFNAGDSYLLINAGQVKIGVMICWDAAFPEPSRLLSMAGAELLIVIAAWELPYVEQWKLAMRSRAFDNGLPLAAVNRVGKDEELEFFGCSLLIDALGNIIKEGPCNTEDIIHYRFNLDLLQKQRNEFSSQINELQTQTYNISKVKIC